MLPIVYLLAKFLFHTAENERATIFRKLNFCAHRNEVRTSIVKHAHDAATECNSDRGANLSSKVRNETFLCYFRFLSPYFYNKQVLYSF